MDEAKNIDALAVRHVEKKCELLEIRQAILNSSRPVAIVFIDLVGSTSLKHNSDDETWLVSIYEFIELIAGLARETRGTLVKRLGDGALITFEDVLTATTFIDAVANDSQMGVFPCKIAADFGNVYYFKFEDHLKDDPYGPVVDRCARLLELSCPGLPLFGECFAKASLRKDEFHVALQFPLKGFPQPETIMVRTPIASRQAREYLEPLLAVLNDRKICRLGYRYAARVFSEEDFSSLPRKARPFLLRELINIPKLPYSYSEFSARLRALSNDEDIYGFYGSLVEWECTFRSYSRLGDDEITVSCGSEDHHGPLVQLCVPTTMFDVVRQFKKDSRIRFRGIIQAGITTWLYLNYVDFEVPDQAPRTTISGDGGGTQRRTPPARQPAG